MRLFIALLAFAVVALSACSPAHTDDTPHEMPTPPTEGEATTPSVTGTTFTVVGSNFKYVINGQLNPEIRVKQGDTVRIEYTTESGYHDFVIDELSAATPKLGEGKSATIEFVASNAGTFEYYCSVGSHRAMGMKGTVIVE